MRQQRGRRVRGQRFVQLTHNWQMTIGNGVIASLPGLSPKQILTGWLKGRQRGVNKEGGWKGTVRQATVAARMCCSCSFYWLPTLTLQLHCK